MLVNYGISRFGGTFYRYRAGKRLMNLTSVVYYYVCERLPQVELFIYAPMEGR